MPSGRLAVRRTREPADSSAADQIPEHDETSGSSSDEDTPDPVGCWPPCTRSTRIELSQLRARHERTRDALFECRDANARLEADASGLRDENVRLREELDELKAQLLDVAGFLSSKSEDARVLEEYTALLARILAQVDDEAPQTRVLMPQLYDLVGRLADDAVHAQYIELSSLILGDDGAAAALSAAARGEVEGIVNRLGEMLDEPRHVRMAKLGREKREREAAAAQQGATPPRRRRRRARWARQRS